jgi:hypothetical protein
VIDDELRAIGVDVDALRDDAKQIVQEATPAGWQAILVRSRWPEDHCPGCRAPITGDNLAIATLTRRLNQPCVLLFTLVIVCDRCVKQDWRLGGLAAITFA